MEITEHTGIKTKPSPYNFIMVQPPIPGVTNSPVRGQDYCSIFDAYYENEDGKLPHEA